MSSTTTAVKVLAVGSAVGSIKDLFAKIKSIDAKHGKFDFALCTGDFFGGLDAEELLSGQIEAPIECYVMQGASPLPDSVLEKFAKTGGELCKNVYLLSKSGLITTAHGLRIACLGGIYDAETHYVAETAPGFASPFFSHQTTSRLLSNTLSTSSSQKDFSSLSNIMSTSSSSQLVDILMSNNWPSVIPQFSAIPIPPHHLDTIAAPPLDETVRHCKPRYHFAAGGSPSIFWEREPFVWDNEQGRATRFLSLGAFGCEAPASGKKQRWFYAFSIAPNSPTNPQPRPTNATKNPFTEVLAQRPAVKRPLPIEDSGQNYIFGDVERPVKRQQVDRPKGVPPPGYKCRKCESSEHFVTECPEREVPPESYVCKICSVAGHFLKDCPEKASNAVGDTGGRKPRPGYVCRACGSEEHYLEDCRSAAANGPKDFGRGKKRGPPREIGPDECWFCLSNPSLAKHLIVSIGTEVYLSLPKGGIFPTQSGDSPPDVPGGGHLLLIPVPHYPTYTTIPRDIAASIVAETRSHQDAIRAYFSAHNCDTLFFEIARVGGANAGHAHINAVAIPRRLKVTPIQIQTAFIEEGIKQGVYFADDPMEAMSKCADGSIGYFSVDLPSGEKIVHLITMRGFDLNFGRAVLVGLLGHPERMDWKTCVLSVDDESADAQTFREAYKKFEPAQ